MTTYPAAILFDLDDTLISFDGVSDIAWDKIKRKWYWSDPLRHKAGRESIKQARRDIISLTLGHAGQGHKRYI